MNQQQAIIKHFKSSKTLTAHQASAELGITQLASRLIDLRAAGHKFGKVTVKGLNRFGNPSQWAVYSYLGSAT